MQASHDTAQSINQTQNGNHIRQTATTTATATHPTTTTTTTTATATTATATTTMRARARARARATATTGHSGRGEYLAPPFSFFTHPHPLVPTTTAGDNTPATVAEVRPPLLLFCYFQTDRDEPAPVPTPTP